MTVKIDFDISDFMRVASSMSIGVPKIKNHISVRLGFLANTLGRSVAKQTPKTSGKLAASTRAIKENEVAWKIVQTATASKRGKSGYLYGKGVRFGTRSHPIPPRFKKALYWPGIIGGRPIPFVKKHPGQRPNRYDRKALAASKGTIRQVSRSIASEAAMTFLGKK